MAAVCPPAPTAATSVSLIPLPAPVCVTVYMLNNTRYSVLVRMIVQEEYDRA